MTEPLRRTIEVDRLILLAGAVNWLVGYVEGSGGAIPEHIKVWLAELNEWSKPS